MAASIFIVFYPYLRYNKLSFKCDHFLLKYYNHGGIYYEITKEFSVET